MDISVLQWKLLSTDYWQNTIQTDIGFKSVTWKFYHRYYVEYVPELRCGSISAGLSTSNGEHYYVKRR